MFSKAVLSASLLYLANCEEPQFPEIENPDLDDIIALVNNGFKGTSVHDNYVEFFGTTIYFLWLSWTITEG